MTTTNLLWHIGVGSFGLALFLWAVIDVAQTLARPMQPECVFDRNEPRKGEPGDGLDGKPVNGWWWDIYKCSDGTERRVLVAGPRG
jgi:hypothetical protein